jgi:hypothetical protein
MIAAKLVTIGEEGGRPKNGANLHPSAESVVTRAEAAELLNVSPRSVATARKVIRNGTPALVEAVRNGEIAVSRAAKVADLSVNEKTPQG